MKFTASIARSLQTDMQAELRDIERAVAAGTRDAGRGLKTELRRQVASAGLGQRLANSWRDKHYPNQELDAASLVYTKAPQIIRAFDEGAVIRSKRGRFLAIPTENAPRNILTGEVFGRNMQRHRHQEFLRFLNALERDIPAGKVVHVILDNYAAHRHERVRAWLVRHPRWIFHFTPTSSLWLNAVEGFFAKLTRRRLKHGVFHSVVDLQAAINRFVTEHNEVEARPFIWRADPGAIVASRNRGFQALGASG
jgi:transposase